MLLKSGPSSVCSLVSIDQQRVVSTSVSFLRLGLFIALACLFSTADEYETALIAERRAQGRYTQARSYWPVALFIGCTMIVLGTAVLFA